MIQIKHKKILMVSGFLVTIVICIAIVFAAQKLVKTWKEGFGTSYPQKTLDVSVDLSQREKFFEQLTRFADAYDFKIHIGPTTPAGDTFSIYMSREDVIVWGDNVIDTRTYNIAFYDENPANPASEGAIKTIEALVSDLKIVLGEIPNATITEVQKSLRIKLDESQREEFFALIRKLADEHSLELTLTVSSDKSFFHTEIYGDGFHIIGEPVVGSPKEILITFFIDYHKVPTSASLETVDEIFDELKNLLSKITNVTIIEEK